MSNSKLNARFQPKPLPTDPAEIHFKRAWQFRKEKRYREAVEEFELSLTHHPGKGATHFNLGWVYDKLEDGTRAMTHVRKSLECFERDGTASNIDTARNLLNKLTRKYEKGK